jgi:hypothetical protein
MSDKDYIGPDPVAWLDRLIEICGSVGTTSGYMTMSLSRVPTTSTISTAMSRYRSRSCKRP